MKITLDHSEIDQALIDFVRKQGLDVKAGDIQITVKDGHISAELATKFLKAVDPTVAVKEANPVVPVAAVVPVTPDAVLQTEDADRETMKAQLDELGIEYAPKARTATLQALLEEANPPQPTSQLTSDTVSIFGSSPEVESPPFEVDTDKQEIPTIPPNEPDDDKPLFGV